MAENPFSAPLTDQKPRRRWLRVILAGVIGLFGVATIAFNAFTLWYQIFLQEMPDWRNVPWPFAVWEIELRLVPMLAGAVFLFCARLFWQGRWRLGGVLVVVAWVAAFLNPPIHDALRHQFAGDQYTYKVPDGAGGADTVRVEIED